MALLVAISSGAVAQSRADALIDRGVELRMAHKDREALEQFQKAHAMEPTPRAMAQIGLAEQALGLWAEAEKHLNEVLKSSSDAWVAKNREALADALRTIGTHLGSLEIDCSESGAELFVNGNKVSALPLSAPIRLEAGSAVIEVRKQGFVAVRRPVEISAGAVARERVVLVASSASPEASSRSAVPASSAPAAPLQKPRSTTPTAAYVLGGVGVAGLVVAGTFGVLALSKKGELSSDCVDANLCGSSADSEANKTAHRNALIADVGAAVGVVGLGLGIWMALSGPKEPAVQPLVGPGTAGLGWKTRF